MDTFKLDILTPYNRYLSSEVTFLALSSEDYSLGILPHHAPLVTTVKLGIIRIRFDQEEYRYATSGGLLEITKEKATLILDSIEREDEIDFQRAEASKSRAEKRLESINDSDIDVSRAEASLARAINRLSLAQDNN